MHWELCGRIWSLLNLRQFPIVCLEDMKKKNKNLSQDSQYTGRGLNPEPPGIEVVTLPTTTDTISFTYSSIQVTGNNKSS
jgi:hypothetical protein